jgi:hypothetical protein
VLPSYTLVAVPSVSVYPVAVLLAAVVYPVVAL